MKPTLISLLFLFSVGCRQDNLTHQISVTMKRTYKSGYKDGVEMGLRKAAYFPHSATYVDSAMENDFKKFDNSIDSIDKIYSK